MREGIGLLQISARTEGAPVPTAHGVMRQCNEARSATEVEYILAKEVHVDMYLEVQATSECVEASFARAN